ncbi:M1 family metallopeptidase [bacterium]|nr:M1 family metallopeptidase [bacterium]
MRAFTTLWIGLAALCSLYAQQTEYPAEKFYTDPDVKTREHVLDIERLKLDVSFDPPKGLVKGKITHYFKPIRKQVDSIVFDGTKLSIIQAKLNGKDVKFKNTGSQIIIYPQPALAWNSKDSISFVYEAHPRAGIYFVGWKDRRKLSQKQIWTQGEDTDHRHWMPLYDDPSDKMITEMIVTFDKDYQVISNGKKISEKINKDGTKTWHYAMSKPHASYLIMLSIGRYDIKTVYSKRGVPIHLYYYPGEVEKMEWTYRYSAATMDFLEEAIGIPYPWESMANIPVQDFVTGAMENTTAVLYGEFWYVDKRAYLDDFYVDTDVHEQAHQWFGDLITMRNWKHLWLQESFATYYAKLGTRKFFGEDYYQWERRSEQTKALSAGKSDRLPIMHTQGGVPRVYDKGSAVLDMMAYAFGSEELSRVVYHFLSHHRYGSVDTHDFYASFLDTLGVTPDWFFDQWIYRGGEPHYEVSYRDVTWQGNRQTEITVNQIHPVDDMVKLFKMPIIFEVYYEDGSSDRVKEWIEKASQKVVIPNSKSKTVSFVLFDPGSIILKDVTFDKSLNELKAQVRRAPNMIDRYDALVGLRSFDPDEKRDLLVELFEKETFQATKGEIVLQLVNDSDPKSMKLIRRALADPDAEVRRAVIQNVQTIPNELLADYEALLNDPSYDNIWYSLIKLTSLYPANTSRYLDLTKDVIGMGRAVRLKWLEISLAAGNADAMKELIDYTSNACDFRTRIATFYIIKKLNYLDDTVIGNLLDAALNANSQLSNAATGTIGFFTQQETMRLKIRNYYFAHDWEDWEREVIETVIF